jgi:hypothetical protein
MDIAAELAAAHDLDGRPLDPAAQDRLRAAAANLTPEVWQATAGLLVGHGLTVWQACREVDPWYAKRYTAIPAQPPSLAIIVAALRHATGTTADHQRRALRRSTWASLRAYYDDDPVREWSHEIDYGGMWTAAGDPAGWPRWRVSYATLTGEVYALRQAAGELVALVGVAHCRDDVERKLNARADPDRSGHDLAWAFHQFGRTLPAEATRRMG